MPNRCVIVADKARARFFTLFKAADPALESGPRLVEQQDLVDPEGELTGQETYSSRSGRAHSASGGPAHGLDANRRRHEHEVERRFARCVAETAVEFVDAHAIDEILLVAEPHLLGMLRKEFNHVRFRGIEMTDLAEDLSWHAIPHIEDVLTRRGLLAARHEPSQLYRPRGQPPP